MTTRKLGKPFSNELSPPITGDVTFEREEFVPTTRDLLLDGLRQGKVRPNQAEAEAARLGLGPLEKTPDSSLHNPMQKSRWSIPMAIAWIVSKRPEDVMEQDNDYLADCLEFRGVEIVLPENGGSGSRREVGWELVQPHPATTYILPYVIDPEACRIAQSKLWNALQEGKLTAEGVRANGEVVDVPTREWPHLVACEEHGREYFAFEHHLSKHIYSTILLKRDEVVRVWPDTAQTKETQKKPKGVAKQTLIDAVVSYIAEHYPSGVPGGITDKKIASGFYTTTKQSVSVRTVRRARARL